jgi:hypothetical protein
MRFIEHRCGLKNFSQLAKGTLSYAYQIEDMAGYQPNKNMMVVSKSRV